MSKIPDQINLLQQLMDNMTDNIYFKDRESRLIMLNQADAEWLGYENPEEVIGKSNFDLFSHDFAQAALDDELRIMETGKPLTGKTEYVKWGDGQTKWISTTKIPMRDQHDTIVGCIGIGRDITEIKEKEAELEEANRKLIKANEQIAEDLRMAANLQQTFLPQWYPSYLDSEGNPRITFHHHYEADTEVGGDLCSIHKLDENQVCLFICDVMGHGVRAALITGIIKTISDQLIRTTESPHEFMTEMNRRLAPMLRAEGDFLFATACLFVVDLNACELHGAMAGHPPPVLMQQGLNNAGFLDLDEEAIGPALAVCSEYDYQPIHARLNQGDSLLLYTDGIYEVTNTDGEELGMDTLLETIKRSSAEGIEGLVRELVAETRTYSHEGAFNDDVCLLGVSLAAPSV